MCEHIHKHTTHELTPDPGKDFADEEGLIGTGLEFMNKPYSEKNQL